MLAVCMVPQTWKVIRDGNAHGTAFGMIALWGMGEALAVIYIAHTYRPELAPLALNFVFNLILATIVLVYKAKDVCYETK
jgi:uncharacterized protein with PQ loop repeat